MRTTVTLDSDVEQALREVMARDGISFKQALNQAVRAGIGPRVEYTYVTPTFDLQPLVNMDNPRHVLAQLDEDSDRAKLALPLTEATTP